MKKLIGFFFAFALVSSVPQAWAVSICNAAANNLVGNCGFETGSFSSWTLTGNDVPQSADVLYGVEGADPFGPDPNSGNWQAFFADQFADPTTISQNLNTVAGTSYDIKFYVAQTLLGPGTVKNSLTGTFGGTTFETLSNVGVEGYTLYTASATATSNLTTLSFSFGNDIGQFQIDDIVVTKAPEPSTWALLLTGTLLLGLFGFSRRAHFNLHN
jgi:hypothetical protein